METAVALASCQFSSGASFRRILCRILGIEAGFYHEKSSGEKDLERLKMSKKKNTKKWKGRRRQLKYQKTKQPQKRKLTEGETYEADAF